MKIHTHLYKKSNTNHYPELEQYNRQKNSVLRFVLNVQCVFLNSCPGHHHGKHM